MARQRPDVSPMKAGARCLSTLSALKPLDATPKLPYCSKPWNEHLPRVTQDRIDQATISIPTENRHPYEQSASGPRSSTLFVSEKKSTVLYLAYGSNLSAETFQGKRGIRPLAAINVVVPSLTMTFDLPGVPYSEPCFANTRYRSSTSLNSTDAPLSPFDLLHSTSTPSVSEEKPSFRASSTRARSHGKPHHHKDRWPHGLVGVVYEVTPSDYAHIIATEGGGAAYQDITIACYPLPENTSHVPEIPDTKPFFAHTLFAPPDLPEDSEPHTDEEMLPVNASGAFSRPDPSYAQPSARYLKLITDGATEHSFPPDYMSYLFSLQPYTITSQKQQLGQFIFLAIWQPIIMFLFGLAAAYGNRKGGRSPKWLVWLTGRVFLGMWVSYDGVFRGMFGDGERTVDGDGDGDEAGWDDDGSLIDCIEPESRRGIHGKADSV